MSTNRVADIAAAVRAGERSAVTVAEEYLALADAYDAIQPQTWIARLNRDDVLARAKHVDEQIKTGKDLPLAGVPFAVKDNIDIAGVPTTAGCRAFAYTPAESATVISRLLAAGAVAIGKTNLDQFATGLTGSRSPYGSLGCVFNRDYISGGSSSGSAVATAAGVVAFALGTDTAGSGRVPAAFNGLTGLKPTKGRWSTRGVVPACRSLDCVSVFTASAADAAHIDAVLAAFDEADPYSRATPTPGEQFEAKRLGIPRDRYWSGDAQSVALFEIAKIHARQIGLELVEIDATPLLECARLLYQGPWIAERAVAIGKILREQPSAIHPVVRTIVQAGTNIPASDVFEGLYALKAYERAAQKVWHNVDALLFPTAPTIYRIAEVLAEPFALNANLGLFTNFVNLLDMAAINIPAGYRDNATGFGVSLIGPAWSDPHLLHLASRIAAVEPVEPPPLDLKGNPQRVKLAVVGAHLAGMPLHWQLTSRNARLVRACRTQAVYRLYAMTNTSPPKPTLIHSTEGGRAIEVEVYEMDVADFGSFTAEVPAPLAIGTVVLEDGESVMGFVSEPRATIGAQEITHLGGWRAFIASGRYLRIGQGG